MDLGRGIEDWLIDGERPCLWIIGQPSATRTVERAIQGLTSVRLPIGRLGVDHAVTELFAWEDPLIGPIHHLPDVDVVVVDGLEAYQDESEAIWDPQVRALLSQLLGRQKDTVGTRARAVVVSALPPPGDISPSNFTVVSTIGGAINSETEDSDPGHGSPGRWTRQRRSTGTTLEQEISQLLSNDEFREAIEVAGRWWGQFSQTDQVPQRHRLCRVFRLLNDGAGPQHLSPDLLDHEAGTQLLYSWLVAAQSIGDATTALQAALTFHQLLRDRDGDLTDRNHIESSVSMCWLGCAHVDEAIEWAERAWSTAAAIHRQYEGMPTAEAMAAYETAGLVLFELAWRSGGPSAVAALGADYVALERRARDALNRFNRSSVIPLDGPTGPVRFEDVLWGLPAAVKALEADDPMEAQRILEEQRRQWSSRDPSANRVVQQRIRLHAAAAAGDPDGFREAVHSAEELLAGSRWLSSALDLVATESLLAAKAGFTAPDLGRIERSLTVASAYGLAADWFHLLTARAEVLFQGNRRDEAIESATAVLAGTSASPALAARWPYAAAFDGAVAAGLRPMCDHAIDVLVRADAGSEEELRNRYGIGAGSEVQRRYLDEPIGRRIEAGADQRSALHEAALEVMQRYDQEGVPYALFLRSFGGGILHGPAEFGMKTLENHLRDGLPDSVGFISIQDPGATIGYTGDSNSALSRDAPALSLADDEWQSVAELLIANADLIVSECLSLSPGVTFELERAFRLGVWDRTVLALPPQQGPYPVIDGEPLVQMFPRCVWLDQLHTDRFVDLDPIKDLIDRIENLNGLPSDELRALRQPADRLAAFPIDLEKLAVSYEISATTSSLFAADDDRVVYYAFWEFYRSGSIRSQLPTSGDESTDNRIKLAEIYLQMAEIMLATAPDQLEGRVVLIGDLGFARDCATSVLGILRDGDPPPLVDHLSQRASRLLGLLERLETAMAEDPDRFVLSPQFGQIQRKRRSETES